MGDEALRIDPAWVVAALGTIGSAAASTIAYLYRGQIAAYKDQLKAFAERVQWLETECKNKDLRTDLLIGQLGRLADAADHSISSAERRQRDYR